MDAFLTIRSILEDKLMSLLKKLFGKEEKQDKKFVAPFLNSALQSSEKEAMAAILIEVMQMKGKKLGEKISVSEFGEAVEKMKEENNLPTVYELFFSNCWNACYKMADERLLIMHQKGKESGDEAYIIIAEKLFTILELDIPN